LNHGDLGDEWIDSWIARWGDRITRYAFVLLRDSHLAQDVAQETFLRLYQMHIRHPDRAMQPAWLFTVARRYAFDLMRHHDRTVPWDMVPDDQVNHQHPGVGNGILLQDLLEHLAPLDRECLWLFYYLDWTTNQIAQHLKITPGAARGRLLRARRRLHELWEVDSDVR
jgi:RNA polymerase sigma-70 factor (ECF subfamily)